MLPFTLKDLLVVEQVILQDVDRAVPIWVFRMYQYLIWIPPKEADNQ